MLYPGTTKGALGVKFPHTIVIISRIVIDNNKYTLCLLVDHKKFW